MSRRCRTRTARSCGAASHALQRTERPGLRALLETSGLTGACLDSDSIGYTLGPRLNAAGRLAHARLALDLMLETDPASAMKMALELGRLNAERQQATAAAMDLARELLAKEDPDAPLIFIGHRGHPVGDRRAGGRAACGGVLPPGDRLPARGDDEPRELPQHPGVRHHRRAADSARS